MSDYDLFAKRYTIYFHKNTTFIKKYFLNVYRHNISIIVIKDEKVPESHVFLNFDDKPHMNNYKASLEYIRNHKDNNTRRKKIIAVVWSALGKYWYPISPVFNHHRLL